MHESISIWDSSVSHKYHNLVDRLGILGKVVPEHSRVISMVQVCLWVTLLCMDEVRELGWISQKENRRVICHHVQSTLLCLELHGEATGISCQVG